MDTLYKTTAMTFEGQPCGNQQLKATNSTTQTNQQNDGIRRNDSYTSNQTLN